MEEITAICNNPWCKAHFSYIPNEGVERQVVCNKCKSFNNELSGGVTWVEKTYEGDRFDGMPHEFSYKIKNYY